MLIAYHGNSAEKDAILAQLARHRKADALVQGYGYWKDGKGCAVGCTIKSGDHMQYEPQFGIPVAIARLEDAIFESLPVDLARQWPERLMNAVQPGQDLSRVHWHLMHWLLTDETVNSGINHPLVKDAVRQCADIMTTLKNGGTVSASAAWSAAIAAKSAAWSAKSVASAAWSAKSAESAAWSAESAAWSAEWSAAWSAAGSAKSAEWSKIADKLIEFINAAPLAAYIG